MNLLKALLDTYDYALEEKLVDVWQAYDEPVILPLYHSSKKVTNANPIFELVIDENFKCVDGYFLKEENIAIFPISESSIVRSGSKVAPHLLCDELVYLNYDKNISKSQIYRENLDKIANYEKLNPCSHFRRLYKYLVGNSLLDDVVKYISKGRKYKLNGVTLEVIESSNNKKEKKQKYELGKIFITFALVLDNKNIQPISANKILHQFYIAYVESQLEHLEKGICDVSGEMGYIVSSHRGLLGNAKLISVSTHKEHYYGRIKDGKNIFSMSFSTSQKVHNMLKYFLDKPQFRCYLGENAYVISWFSHDLYSQGAPLINSHELNIDEDDDEIEDVLAEEVLGSTRANSLVNYFTGNNNINEQNQDNYFYVLILEKSSNGRISVKYFKQFDLADIRENIEEWYKTVKCNYWSKKIGKYTEQTPTLLNLVNMIYGNESNGKLSCSNEGLQRNAIEYLLPCVIDGKFIPRHIMKKTFYNLMHRQSYPKTWHRVLELGYAIINKYKNQYNKFSNSLEGDSKMGESRSFLFGRLLAIYEKMENDATKSNANDIARVTNAERLWSSMINAPNRTAQILANKMNVYRKQLKKKSNGIALDIYYQQLLGELYEEIYKLEKEGKSRLNEDFILGYYNQRQKLYGKRIEDK